MIRGAQSGGIVTYVSAGRGSVKAIRTRVVRDQWIGFKEPIEARFGIFKAYWNPYWNPDRICMQVNKKRTDLDKLLEAAVHRSLSRHMLTGHLLQSPRIYSGEFAGGLSRG
jgi:hypothetical protein